MKTIEEAARAWWRENLNEWASNTSGYIINEFEKYLFPAIGHLKLRDVRPRDILSIARAAEITAPSVSRRIVQRLIIIFDLAILNEECEHNPARPVVTALKKPRPGSFASLDEPLLSEFYRKIDAKYSDENPAVLAFWIIQYTALRRSEAIKGRWEEVNWEAKTWTIPGCRMKNGRPLVVPLSPQVASLLQKCTEGNDAEWIFPATEAHRRKKPQQKYINLHEPGCLIRKVGYQTKMTIHGARKVFSTLAHESGLWSIDSIELQLSHRIHGVRGVYNKASLLSERAELMRWYSQKIDCYRGII